jgi:uncharacterized membrane protein HdeD (DUF308 family)
MLEYLSRFWWTLAVRGALAVVLGLAALIWPDITLRVLVLQYWSSAVVDGLPALAAVLVGGRLVSGRRGWLIAAWMVSAGCPRSPPPSSCAGTCAASCSLPSPGSSRWPRQLPGRPTWQGAIAVVWAIGLYTIAFGVALLVFGARLRQLQRRIDGTARMP